MHHSIGPKTARSWKCDSAPDHRSPPSAVWLIGRDDSSADYQVLYYDSRGVSRIYSMSFRHRTWKIWLNSQGFPQRYEGMPSADGNTITARWKKSPDGRNREYDSDMM